MSTLSPEHLATARKSLTFFLRGVERVGQTALAQGCAVDDSTITRDKAIWERIAKEAAIAGIKWVPLDVQCYQPEYVANLRYFAKLGMELHDGTQPIPVRPLTFEDET